MLAEILHKIAAMEFAERKEQEYRPRPSMAGPQRCLRQTTYTARGEERIPLAGRAVVVFSDSSWHEELTADLIQKSAWQLHSQQMPVTIPQAYPWRPDGTWKCPVCKEEIDSHDCHGHIDYIVTDLAGRDVLVEHKALSHFGFEALMKDDLEMPLDYLTQGAIYLRGVQIINPDVKDLLLLIKNKNQSGYLEFECTYNSENDVLTVLRRNHHTGDTLELNVLIPDITKSAYARFEAVDQHVTEETLPVRQYDMDHWRCEYCGYRKTCWSAWAEEHNELATDEVIATDAADIVAYERQLTAQLTEMENEKDGLRQQIKDLLTAAGVRQGRAGEYIVDWSVKNGKKFDKDLVHPNVRRECMVDVINERLTIKKVKVET